MIAQERNTENTINTENHWTINTNHYQYHEKSQDMIAQTLVIEYVEKRAILGNITPKSVSKYYGALKMLLNIMNDLAITITTLSEQQVIQIIRSLNTLTTQKGTPLSEDTKKEYSQIWKSFLLQAKERYGENWDKTAYKTIEKYVYKRDKNKIIQKSTFTPEEWELLLRNEKSIGWHLFFKVLFEAGPRIGEALSVRNQDVANYEDGMASIHFPKGKTGPRTIYIAGKTAEQINRWKNLHPYYDEPETPFFLNTALRPINYKAAEERFKELVKKSGLQKNKPCLHGIRASAVTKDSQHMSSQVIRKKYGWTSSSRMEEKYVRQSGIDLKEAEITAYRSRHPI